jgi:hypothetical protein
MTPVTHQTVRLSRGKHSSEEHGACVMELASMLAGEPFSDHPDSVCPVIAAVLRAYNDWVDDDRRQELYGYAAKVVGSRASTRIERARAKQMISWIAAPPPGRLRRLLLPGPRVIAPWPPYDALGTQAVRVIARRGHGDLLACVDRLLEMGSREMATAPCVLPDSAPAPRSPARISL